MSAPPHEKDSVLPVAESIVSRTVLSESTTRFQRLTAFLGRFGVETHGIDPVPRELRVDRRNYQLMMIWFSSVMNLQGLTVGAGGPVVFKLSFKNAAINLLITDVLSLIIPAYFAIFGPKLGTRSLVQARFSWGVYGVVLPSVLNVFSMIGYLIIGIIVGGQLLARATDNLSSTSGIIINAFLTLAVSFCGYRVIHWFASLAWIPTVVGLVTMLSVGGRYLGPAIKADEHRYPHPTVASTLSFAATVAAGNLSWCTMMSDYGVYHDAKGSTAMVFTYSYVGLFIPSILTHLLGAAFAVAAPHIHSWRAGYEGGNNLGGLISAVLAPCGRFGTFLVVIMALSITGVNAPTMYSCGISLMNVSRVFAKIPRYVFAILATAIIIPISIVAEAHFYSALVSVFNLIGYWCSSYAAIIFIEHVLFRRRQSVRYEVCNWDNAAKLPPGLAAILSFCSSFALIVPCMKQTWYVGPIARSGTGDIGLLVGFFGTCVIYAALRAVEIQLFPGHDS